MKDYSIKGTPLPVIKRDDRLEYRITHWAEFSKNSYKMHFEKDFVSFGLKEFKNTIYVLAEKVDYEGKNYYMFKLSDIKRLDEEQFILPSKWCVEVKSFDDYKKHALNKGYSLKVSWLLYERPFGYYYYSDKNTGFKTPAFVSIRRNFDYQEITFEQFKKHVLKEEFDNQNKKEMTTRTITYQQAQEIIDEACLSWKNSLFEKWGKSIVLKESIEISEDFYQEMRNACTTEQHILFDKIFGKDLLYKKGDWVYKGKETNKWNSVIQLTKDVNINSVLVFSKDKSGKEDWISINTLQRLATEEEIKAVQFPPKGTPCLIRQHFVSSWKLAYSNGDGKFTSSDRYNSVVTYKHYQILDINNLPIK